MNKLLYVCFACFTLFAVPAYACGTPAAPKASELTEAQQAAIKDFSGEFFSIYRCMESPLRLELANLTKDNIAKVIGFAQEQDLICWKQGMDNAGFTIVKGIIPGKTVAALLQFANSDQTINNASVAWHPDPADTKFCD